jgi:hypothetical protein
MDHLAQKNSTLKMGTELFPEMSEHFHILMWLSAQEDLIEFCHHESFKTYTKNLLLALFS